MTSPDKMPTTNQDVAGVGMVSSGVGSLLSYFGAKQEGTATQAMYNYQAGIAQLNQKIALQNRDYSLATGEQQAAQEGMKQRAIAGRTKAVQGASGIDVGSGSSVDVQTSEAKIAGMDLATIRNNAARKAYGYTVEAAQDTAQAGLYTMAGVNAKQAADIKATGSLISGVTGVADKWLQASSMGLV